ncbi:CDP-alcohol phosphatidyltransferase [Rhodosalinus halophilus]|uniref:CDP-alcohol phosphatidyltransferase n=1 Tax=Rhodosalinus halophilus TaxID=2259333 RepID=A0A365U5M9_9RHOB|nr:CDP-alcohol phosphatidyltransferase family protein [Rhodosalinus halophilus]RBI83699.1 CDP-alcohol phosphatidyltransferase [Rhodosalinus halophilus]
MALLGTDLSPARRPLWPGDLPAVQLTALGALHLTLLACALALWPGGIEPPVWAASLSGHAAVTGLAIAAVARSYPHRSLGMCNSVTHLRATLTVFLAAALASGPGVAEAWVLAGIGAITLALDGADGWLARRRGLVSRFGARFDVEIDALFALVLAAAALAAGKIGWVEAVVLGAARHLFLLAGAALPWLRAPLPERVRRKAICVVQLAVLVALLTPALEGRAAQALGLAAATLVAASFAADILALWQARRRG